MKNKLRSNVSKTLINVLLAFIVLFFGLEVYILINTTKSQVLKGINLPMYVTFERFSYILIITGILILTNIRNWLPKLFLPTKSEFDLEKFTQDNSYIIKSSFYFIQRNNQEIIIKQSKKKFLLLSISLGIVLLVMLYLLEPLTIFFLVNLNPLNPMYNDSNTQEIILTLLGAYILIFVVLMFLIALVSVLIYHILIIIDLESRQIKFTTFLTFPLNLVLKRKSELFIPLENIKSLSLNTERYTDFNDITANIKESQFLTISSSNWNGNEKLLKKFSIRGVNGRLKFIHNNDVKVLNELKTFLIDFASKGYYN